MNFSSIVDRLENFAGVLPPLVESICQSMTFVQHDLESPPPQTYSRVDNPTVAALELVLGRLENAPPAVPSIFWMKINP